MTKMKKSVAKTISALCIALSVFMLNSTFAFAAVCNDAPDGVHHFTSHKWESTYTEDAGTHRYLYGYDSQHNPIYYDDCRQTDYYWNCIYKCKYCGTEQDGSSHTHYVLTKHSISHN